MLSFAKLSLSNLNINGRGNKTGILIYGSERLEHTFNEPARCLFGPSAFGWDEQVMRQGIPFELAQEMSGRILREPGCVGKGIHRKGIRAPAGQAAYGGIYRLRLLQLCDGNIREIAPAQIQTEHAQQR